MVEESRNLEKKCCAISRCKTNVSVNLASDQAKTISLHPWKRCLQSALMPFSANVPKQEHAGQACDLLNIRWNLASDQGKTFHLHPWKRCSQSALMPFSANLPKHQNKNVQGKHVTCSIVAGILDLIKAKRSICIPGKGVHTLVWCHSVQTSQKNCEHVETNLASDQAKTIYLHRL